MNTLETLTITDGESRKRICLTCDLKNNPELIAEYRKLDSPSVIGMK